MNRREFLMVGSAVVAGGAAALGGQPGTAGPAGSARQDGGGAGRRARQYKKAVMYGMLTEGSGVLERFRILREAGFDGVEMDGPSRISPEEILRARDETGLAVHGIVDSVHWQRPLSHPHEEVRRQGLEGLLAAIRDAHRFGATSVLLVPAVVDKEVGYDEAWERSAAEVRKALPLAAELRVVIGIENVWNNFLLSPLEAARYVDAFGSPWVKWHFDVGNVVAYGWPEQWVRILGERVCKLHIKEYSRKKRDEEGRWKGFDVELLEGDCGWAAVMAALDATAYESRGGWATAEVRGGDAARMREIAEKMDRIFAM